MYSPVVLVQHARCIKPLLLYMYCTYQLPTVNKNIKTRKLCVKKQKKRHFRQEMSHSRKKEVHLS